VPGAEQGPAVRPLSAGRLVLLRLRRRLASSVALLLAFAMLSCLLNTVALLQLFSGEAGLQSTLQTLGAGRNVDISLSGLRGDFQPDRSQPPVSRAAYAAFVASTDNLVRSTLAQHLRQSARYIESEDLQPGALPGGGPAANVIKVVGDQEMLAHVQVIQGALMTPQAQFAGQPVNATVTSQAAQALGLRVGSTECFRTLEGNDFPCLRIGAVWTQRPADPYWQVRAIPTSALIVDERSFFALLAMLPPTFAASAHVVYAPSLATFHEKDLGEIRADFRRLRTGATTLGSVQVATDLDSALGSFQDARLTSRFPIQLVLTQVVLLAALQVAFVASRVLGRQSELLGVWRSRGWSWLRLSCLLATESVILALPAAILGLAAALVISLVLTRLSYEVDLRGLLPDAAIRGLAWSAVAVATSMLIIAPFAVQASRRRLLEVRHRASRPSLRGWWQWRFADVGFALLAVPLLLATRILGGAQLRSQGAVGGDPLSLALPGLALLGVALVLLRLLPLIALAGSVGRPGATRLMASIELGRRPFQHGAVALLLMLTVALGTFAGIYATSAVAGAKDGAAYSVGSDLRAHFQPGPVALAGAVGGLSGVQGASLVYRDSGEAQASSFRPTVLGVEPDSFRGVVWTRPDLAQRPLLDLIQELADRESGGFTLPGRPDHLGIWAYSSAGVRAHLTVDLADSSGRLGTASLGSLAFSGWRYLEGPLTHVAGRPTRYPLRVRDLAVQADPGGAGSGGLVGLSQLDSGGADRVTRTVVEPFSGWAHDSPGWWQTPAPAFGGPQLVAPAEFNHAGNPAVRFRVEPGLELMLIRPPPSIFPVPALLPQATMDRNGLQVGQQFDLTVNSVQVRFVVIDAFSHFPTLYPEAEDFLVAAQAPLLAWIARYGADRVWPTEAWLRVSSMSEGLDAQVLRGRAGVDSVVSRQEAEAAAVTNPAMRELQADLAVAAAVALGLTILASAIHFLLLMRQRLREYAILQANGLGRRAIGRSFALEQGLVLAFGSMLGAGLGSGLALVVIPALQLSSNLTSTVPGITVRVDPLLAGLALGGVAGLGLFASWLTARGGTRYRLMDELRTLEG